MQSDVMYVDMTGAGNVGEHRPKSNAFKVVNERLARWLAPRLRSAAPMNRGFALLGLALALGSSACSPTIGASCTQSTDCSSQGNRVCDNSQPDGYCTVFGCADNSCPDHAVCVTFAVALPGCAYNDYEAPARTMRTLCLQHCQSDSDCRASEGYVCLDPKGPPFSARILDDNQNQKVCVVAITPVDAGQSDGGSAVCSAGRLLPDAETADVSADGGASAADVGAADVTGTGLGDAADAP